MRKRNIVTYVALLVIIAAIGIGTRMFLDDGVPSGKTTTPGVGRKEVPPEIKSMYYEEGATFRVVKKTRKQEIYERISQNGTKITITVEDGKYMVSSEFELTFGE